MPEQIPSSVNQAGLSENAAGGLAYITVIPAIIFLFVQPYSKSRYVRFHAWQCIFMAIAWWVIDIGIWIFGHMLVFFRLLTLGLYPLVALAMLILWLMVLIKAFNGEKFKLPVIGDLAEKQANA
ncbi:MAG: DUF4870 domain-containing protein [Terracidiphilus sp.]